MEMKIAYCPFASDQVLKKACAEIIKSHNSEHKLDCFKREVITSGTKALSGVGMFQQLYIVAHGGAGSDSILDDNNVKMTVRELAMQLKLEGLTSRISKVKLYCCNGGSGGVNSTAAQLKVQMLLQGFTNVSVYGYELLLAQGGLADNGGKMAGNYDFSLKVWSDVQRAKDVRVKF